MQFITTYTIELESILNDRLGGNLRVPTASDRRLRFSSDADIVRLTNARSIIIIIMLLTSIHRCI